MLAHQNVNTLHGHAGQIALPLAEVVKHHVNVTVNAPRAPHANYVTMVVNAMVRLTYLLLKITDLPGDPVEEKDCNTDVECPPECEWSPDWEPWLPCSATCGGGLQNRRKKCECKVCSIV